MVKKPNFKIAFISWMVLVTLLSLFSFTGIKTSSIKIPHMDKIVHFTFYFVAAILGCLAYKQVFKKKKIGVKNRFLVFIFLVFFGTIIEILQSTITTTRHGDVLDFLANTLGVVGGLIVMYLPFWKKIDEINK